MASLRAKPRFGLVRYAGKTGICVAAVYWTATQGIWGPPGETERTYQQVYHSVSEADEWFEKLLGKKISTIKDESTGFVSQSVISYWNTGIQKTCEVLADIPDLSGKYVKTIADKVKDTFGKTPPSGSS